MDICPLDGNFYAPFDCSCVFHDYVNYADNIRHTSKIAVFTSKEEVECANGEHRIVTFLITHGGDSIPTANGNLKKGMEFLQGQKIYVQGSQGDYTYQEDGTLGYTKLGIHGHLNACFGSFSNFAYPNGLIALPNDVNVENIFFKETDDEVDVIYGYNPIIFTKYVSNPFNPSNKADGWYLFDGKRYYVKNHQCLTGWQQLTDYNSVGTLLYASLLLAMSFLVKKTELRLN